MFTVNYGLRTDWLRNVLSAGGATLDMEGRSIELTDPKMLPRDEGYLMMGPDATPPPGWVGVQECLLMSPVRVDTEA